MPFHNLEPINTKQRNRSRVIRPPEEDSVASMLAFQETEYFRRLSALDLLRSVLNKSNKSNLAFGFDLNLIREVEI
jgi:hypothetical protein